LRGLDPGDSRGAGRAGLAPPPDARARRGVPALRAWRERLPAVIDESSELGWRPRERPVRKRRRNSKLLVAAGVPLAFGLGIAFGEAIHDNPKPGGGMRTVEQTVTVKVAPLRP